jgi:hypothetical protein
MKGSTPIRARKRRGRANGGNAAVTERRAINGRCLSYDLGSGRGRGLRPFRPHPSVRVHPNK